MLDFMNRIRSKNLETWVPQWLVDASCGAWMRRRAQHSAGPAHLLFAFCDHYEPLWGGATTRTGDARVAYWVKNYPQLVRGIFDSDGYAPRHSFFFPAEQYRPEWLSSLAGLTRRNLGEVELHLHHDGDNSHELGISLKKAVSLFSRHGHFGRDRAGRPRFGFIHGNWCLANAREDGKYCGVNDELPILFDSGCYADFTFPSAPDPCQPSIVNKVLWPVGDLAQRAAYKNHEVARVGAWHHDRILMVTGPLALVRERGKWLRIESSAVTAKDPATPERVRSWAAQSITIRGRPEWVFIKIHTHGAPEEQAQSLLGPPGRKMHEVLHREFNDGSRWKLHYVTAREMFNIAMAAMSGRSGNPNTYRDFVVGPPPARMHEYLCEDV